MSHPADSIEKEMLLAATRRHFFRQAGFGIGAAALAGLLNENSFASSADSNQTGPKQPMFPAKAKSVIFLFMAGAPSQVDFAGPETYATEI